MTTAIIRAGLTAVTLFGLICGWNTWASFAGRASAEQAAPIHTPEGQTASGLPAIADLRKQLQQQSDRIRQLEQQESMPARISHDAAASVGLIVGEYIWVDPSGRKPLHYQGLDSNGNYLVDKDGNELMSFDGSGPIVVRGFQSTGFLTDHQTLLTSGFILAPWISDPLLDGSENPKIMPSIRMLHAYFPGVSNALDIKIDRAAESADAVLCKINGQVPAAGLALNQHKKLATGDSIVVMGYPGGVDLLASRVPDEVRREIYKFGRPNMDEAAQILAEKGYIQPIALSSRVSGQTEDRIFFETFGNDGSTGGPLMNSQGQVIGMNQAVHPNYPSFNMATSTAPLRSWITNSER